MTQPDADNSGINKAERQGAEFALETARGFKGLGVRFVVVGGWAVRSLGSPLPSIDMDVLIPAVEWDRREVHDFIEARSHMHKAAYADAYLEVDTLEATNTLWLGFDRGYVPLHLFQMLGTQRVSVEIKGQAVEWGIPSHESLLLMKLKACRDRSMQLRTVLDPVRLARLFPEDRYPFEGIPDAAAFLRRKTGKDLADLAWLHELGTDLQKVARAARELDIVGFLESFIADIPTEAHDEAHRLFKRHQLVLDPKQSMEVVRDTFRGRMEGS